MALLEGKVALVTGAGGGIGRACAAVIAREGAAVVVSDVDVPGGEETVRLITEAGGQAGFLRADVAREADVAALVAYAVERFGRLDCAVNNAGIEGAQAPTADYAEEQWDRVIAVNLKGTWWCMKYELLQMVAQGGGAIVNISSVAGRVGFPNLPAYVASKHGVIGLTRAAALEYALQRIRVNALCPGVIHTAMVDRVTGRDPRAEARFAAMAPMNRMGTPEEVAQAAAWLASDAASFVTGHALDVDGGFSAQ